MESGYSSAPCNHTPVSLLGDNLPADCRILLIWSLGDPYPCLQKEAEPTMKPNSGLADKGIERILKLSANAHIQRRLTVKDSPEFHKLTGAIAAYGKSLELLTALREREEFHAIIHQCDAPLALQPVH